jgi:hypothetical protein
MSPNVIRYTKLPDIYKLWVSDYRELLIAKGVNRHLCDGTWAHPPKGRHNDKWLMDT